MNQMKRMMGVILFAATCLAGSGQQLETFVTGLVEQYPQARLLDVYKSCFQDYMGAEHLVNDTASARGYLEQELTITNVEELQPWYFEPCGIDGNYVRVSLRAVKEGFISPESLLDAFIASTDGDVHPPVECWVDRWHEMIATIDKMGLDLPHYEQDRQFIEDVLAQGKYAISHSPDYREAYAPHYRIVRRDIFMRDLLPKLPCCQ